MNRPVDRHEVGGGGDASDGLSFALGWFTYHAGQRTQTFNFFLVIQGALLALFGALLPNASRETLTVIAGLGAIAPLPFWLLDVRNTELVLNARHFLERLELDAPELGPEDWPLYRDDHRLDLRAAIMDGLHPPPPSRTVEPVLPPPGTVRRIGVFGVNKMRLRAGGAVAFLTRHGLVFRSVFTSALVLWLVSISWIWLR